MQRKLTHILLTLALVFCAATAGAATADKWIHIKVQGNDDEQVMVNLPLSLISAAIAMIPDDVRTEAHDEMSVALDDLQLDWTELMEFWQAVKDSPEATFVTVQSRNETIEVKKEGNFVLVTTTESSENGTEIDVKFPLAVVDALLSGPEGTLNLEAAINALANEGNGHIVSIRDNSSGRGETVQIWIDEQNVSEPNG